MWLALVERNTKKPITEWLKVEDEAAALDFEMAIAFRLLVFDNECAEAQAKRIATEVSKALIGDGETSDENSVGRVTEYTERW